jgi:thiosulfate/3-mercaptopyruvate sulfurtransferase
VLLDVRWRLGAGSEVLASEYGAGHLPGAAFIDLDADLSDPPGMGGRHPLPDPSRFGTAMRRAGLSGRRTVVVYDEPTGLSAARAWWLLRYHGHPDTRVLDGGLTAWAAAGLPMETGVVQPAPGDFSPGLGVLPLLDADKAAVLAKQGVLLDARAPERYRGDVETVDPVAGHIPGAVNCPAGATLDQGGRLRDPEELREGFARLGAASGAEVGAYCGSGVTAAQLVLALQVAGIPAALYVGSWSDWVSDRSRPVATGPIPGVAG